MKPKYIIAAAGCGKTEHIASEIARLRLRRVLVLTHSNAGVDALRRRFKRYGIPSRDYDLETFARFAYRYCRAFPRMSNTKADGGYDEYYRGAERLFAAANLMRILRARYTQVFVDEYQDCNLDQHSMVLALTQYLPVTILGDPLQAVFRFDSPIVDWDTDIIPSFDELAPLTTPYRWLGKNDILGEWLVAIRAKLLTQSPIDLGHAPLSSVRTELSRDACLSALRASGSVVGIAKLPTSANYFGRQMGGRYQTAEASELTDMKDYFAQLRSANNIQRALLTLYLLKDCAVGFADHARSIFAKLEAGDANLSSLRRSPQLIRAVGSVLDSPELSNVLFLIEIALELDGVKVFRKSLMGAVRSAMKKSVEKGVALDFAAEQVILNRRWWVTEPNGRIISRPRLVKGLEFDHSIVLDCKMDIHEMYVSLTRGSKSLTLICDEDFISPKPPVVSTRQLRLFNR